MMPPNYHDPPAPLPQRHNFRSLDSAAQCERAVSDIRSQMKAELVSQARVTEPLRNAGRAQLREA